MIDTSRHLLVSCRPCGHVWSVATLPSPIEHAAKLVARSQCPNCDSKSRQHFIATEAQAEEWARQQDDLAKRSTA